MKKLIAIILLLAPNTFAQDSAISSLKSENKISHTLVSWKTQKTNNLQVILRSVNKENGFVPIAIAGRGVTEFADFKSYSVAPEPRLEVVLSDINELHIYCVPGFSYKLHYSKPSFGEINDIPIENINNQGFITVNDVRIDKTGGYSVVPLFVQYYYEVCLVKFSNFGISINDDDIFVVPNKYRFPVYISLGCTK